MAAGCSCRTSEEELAKHLRLELTAKEGLKSDTVEFELHFLNTGTRTLWPRSGRSGLVLRVDGRVAAARLRRIQGAEAF